MKRDPLPLSPSPSPYGNYEAMLQTLTPGLEMRDAPPIGVLYRPNQRRIPRVRVFIDFVTELFRELEAERGEKAAAHLRTERPRRWARHGRTSAVIEVRE